VFPGVGKTGHLTDLKKNWNAFRKRAQIPHIRVHDIRRTNGSYAAMAGVSLKTIQEQLGHKSIQSTMVYSHLHDESVRDGREAGQAKMLSMMKAAKKRGQLTASNNPARKALSA
jgi:integrase